jgi:hypothetical protein
MLRDHPIRTLSIESRIAAAVILGVGVGCLIAWLVFATRMPVRLPYAGFFPSAGLLIVYSAVAAGSVGRKESIAKVIAATLVGLLLVLIVGGVLIQMIGCRFDACINL